MVPVTASVPVGHNQEETAGLGHRSGPPTFTALSDPPSTTTRAHPARDRSAPCDGEAQLIGISTGIEDAERPWRPEAEQISHDVATARYQSPLRYAGAKSSLTPVLARLINEAKKSSAIHEVKLLVEPFAGGASTSLRLVGTGVVERILLADADPLVACFWQSAADDSARLLERICGEWTRYVAHGGPRAVARWDYWRSWKPPRHMAAREIRLTSAVRCLFLNRTTFSGILHGRAGPLGGRKQSSPYTIGCRWNQKELEARIGYVGALYGAGRLVDVWCKDWRQTLDDVPEIYPQLVPSNVVAYLDPPYVDKSSLLYRTSFGPSLGVGQGEQDLAKLHLDLAHYLTRKAQFRWILSYDAHPALTKRAELYAQSRMSPAPTDAATLAVRRWIISKRLVTTRYTASGKAGKRSADELLLTTLPPRTVPRDAGLRELRSAGTYHV